MKVNIDERSKRWRSDEKCILVGVVVTLKNTWSSMKNGRGVVLLFSWCGCNMKEQGSKDFNDNKSKAKVDIESKWKMISVIGWEVVMLSFLVWL